MSVETDQQLAGVIMKVITGFYLWMIIATIFFKWSLNERVNKVKYRGKLVPSAAATAAAAAAAQGGDGADGGDASADESASDTPTPV